MLTIALGSSKPIADSGKTAEPAFFDMQYEWVDSLMAVMSTEEKIGQLFMVAAYSEKGAEHEAYLQSLIKEYQIGGLIFFKGHPTTQAHMTNRLQAKSKVPLMVGMDAEWGPSMRLDSTVQYPRQLGMGAIPLDSTVYRFGLEVGRQLKRLGVHINFAPVIDVNNNPNNPVIGDRSFGENRLNVALKGLNYMDGLQDKGVLACGKHFPGHGDTDADSHKSLPVITHSWQRIDSLELFPFKILMQQGLASIMNAHLYIPELDPTQNTASSLSPIISRGILRDSLGFRGLTISDALNMKGVSAYFEPGELEIRAFLAGNDILLFSEDVATSFKAIRTAVAQGRISMDILDQSVSRILKAKAWAGLNNYEPIKTAGLVDDLNAPIASWILREICETRLTLVRNEKKLLPFHTGTLPEMALLDLGKKSVSEFQRSIKEYASLDSYRINGEATVSEFDNLIEKMNPYSTVIVALHDMSRYSSKSFGLSDAEVDFVLQLSAKKDVVLVVFGSPYSLARLPGLKTILVSYDEKEESQKAAARALFGELDLKGRMPVSAGEYLFGQGSNTSSTRMKYTVPEEVGFNPEVLERIDSVMNGAIMQKATPGGRVLLARNGKIFFDKSYGYHTYSKKQPVRKDDVFDLASITKIASTTICLMKLYEEGRLELDKKVVDYLPETEGSEVANLRIKNILTHTSGLKPWIPFYVYSLLEDGGLNPDYYRTEKTGEFNVEVATNIYIHEAWGDSIYRRIQYNELRDNRNYKYSDLGFYLFRRIVERITQMPIEDYVQVNFYNPMGLSTMGYLPLEKMTADQIVPTESDSYFRHQLLQGHVHDMGAAMEGGVEGHAGLFSNAQDLAALVQMLLNGGTYGGFRFFKPETINLFTAKATSNSRRGLGFDKPELDAKKIGPTSTLASPSTFGHSGFTGTCVWADPEYDLVYVFLSNRIHPDMENRKLIKDNIRTKIQDFVYEAIIPKEAEANADDSADDSEQN
ncbi:MAG: beta-N-acetylhexosaminidase [Limisphaerales bacterium]|jgi:beta-N-acetylhexosaminidase